MAPRHPTHTDGPSHVTGLLELTTALIRHHGVHAGRYKLAVGFKIGVGNVGPASEQLPGAVVGIESVSLVAVGPDYQQPDAVDAAQVNPAPSSRARKTSKKPA